MAQLTANDLLEPKGELSPGLWPGLTLDEVKAIIGEHLADGYTRAAVITNATNLNEAARQLAYHRGKRSAYLRLLRTPSSVSLSDEGSSSYLQMQIELLGEEAAAHLAKFEAMVGVAQGQAAAVLNRATQSVPLAFTW